MTCVKFIRSDLLGSSLHRCSLFTLLGLGTVAISGENWTVRALDFSVCNFLYQVAALNVFGTDKSLPPLLQLSVLIRWRPAIIVALTIGEVKAGLGKRKKK